METLSDRGSTPLISTKRKLTAVRRSFLLVEMIFIPYRRGKTLMVFPLTPFPFRKPELTTDVRRLLSFLSH